MATSTTAKIEFIFQKEKKQNQTKVSIEHNYSQMNINKRMTHFRIFKLLALPILPFGSMK